jgi:hypothetical protein
MPPGIILSEIALNNVELQESQEGAACESSWGPGVGRESGVGTRRTPNHVTILVSVRDFASNRDARVGAVEQLTQNNCGATQQIHCG